MALDLLVDLCLALLDQPLYQPRVVLLSVNVVLVLRNERLSPELLLVLVHNPLQLPVLCHVTRRRLLVERLLGLRQCRRQSPVDIQLSPSAQFVHPKQHALTSLRLYVYYRVYFLFCQFETLLRQN